MSDEINEIDLSVPAFLLKEADIFTTPPYARVKERLLAMRSKPPQVLLIEGGSQNERIAACLLWACLLNCTLGNNNCSQGKSASNGGLPVCLSCSACKRFIQAVHRDFFVLDGREESIKIGTIRDWVRPVLGEPPREANKRIILLAEAQALGIEAANSLLKSLEEPRPQNAFIITAPQRERLFPTLVSRSWVLTLPWPEPGKYQGSWEEQAFSFAAGSTGENEHLTETGMQKSMDAQNTMEWELALAEFLGSGRGLLAKTGTKGAITLPIALGLISRLQSALAASLLSGEHAAINSPLYKALAGKITPVLARRAYEAVSVCQTALFYKVNPSLAVDWLATRLFVWLEELRRQK